MSTNYRIKIKVDIPTCDVSSQLMEHMIHTIPSEMFITISMTTESELTHIGDIVECYLATKDSPEIMSLSYRNYMDYDMLVYDIYSNKLQCLINDLQRLSTIRIQAPYILIATLNDEYYIDEYNADIHKQKHSVIIKSFIIDSI